MFRWIFRGVLILIGIPVLLLLLFFLDASIKRPYLIRAGSYTGRVVDAATGNPVEGAAVYLSWEGRWNPNPLERLPLVNTRDMMHIGETLVHTDADGRYRAPEQRILAWVPLRLWKPNLNVLIGKKGYVAFSNTHQFDGGKWRRTDAKFNKRNMAVSLVPWNDSFDFSSHAFFISTIGYYRGGVVERFYDEIIL